MNSTGSGTTIDPCSNMGSFSRLCNLSTGHLDVILGSAISFILIGAVIIALFSLIWNGIRWIASGGDKAKVEGARSGIIAAVIGLIIAFSAFFILSFALSFFGLSLSNLKLPTVPNL